MKEVGMINIALSEGVPSVEKIVVSQEAVDHNAACFDQAVKAFGDMRWK
jgi:hypothetical protein